MHTYKENQYNHYPLEIAPSKTKRNAKKKTSRRKQNCKPRERGPHWYKRKAHANKKCIFTLIENIFISFLNKKPIFIDFTRLEEWWDSDTYYGGTRYCIAV